MALSDPQKAALYEVLGLPQAGSMVIVDALAHRNATMARAWEPTQTEGTLLNTIEKLEERLAALTEDQEARVVTLLTQYDALRASPMQVLESPSGKGVLVDHGKERSAIRDLLMNLLGIFIPPGGFVGEVRRMLGPQRIGGW